MEPAPKFSLNKVDVEKWIHDIAFFSLVPVTFYLTGVLGIIETKGHILAFRDFVPNNATLIAIVTWIFNQLLNIIRKYIV